MWTELVFESRHGQLKKSCPKADLCDEPREPDPDMDYIKRMLVWDSDLAVFSGTMSFLEASLKKSLGMSPPNDLVPTSLSHVFCTELPKHWRSNKSLPVPFRVVTLVPVPENTKVWISAGNEERPHAELKNANAIMNGHEVRFSDLRFLGRSGRGKSFNVTIHIETIPPQLAVYAKAIKVTVDGPRVPRNKYGMLKLPRMLANGSFEGSFPDSSNMDDEGGSNSSGIMSPDSKEMHQLKSRTEFLHIPKKGSNFPQHHPFALSAGRGRKRKFNFQMFAQGFPNLPHSASRAVFPGAPACPNSPPTSPSRNPISQKNPFLSMLENSNGLHHNFMKGFNECLMNRGLPGLNSADLIADLMRRQINSLNNGNQGSKLPLAGSLRREQIAPRTVNGEELQVPKVDASFMVRFESIMQKMKEQQKMSKPADGNDLLNPNPNPNLFNLQQKLMQLQDLNRITEKFLAGTFPPKVNDTGRELAKPKEEEEAKLKNSNKFSIRSVIDAEKLSHESEDERISIDVEGRTPQSHNSGTSSHSPPLTGTLDDEFPIQKRAIQQDSSDEMGSTHSSSEVGKPTNLQKETKNFALSNFILNQLMQKNVSANSSQMFI
ncbi:Runt- transcription factor [Cichlidogyrus casuarinus]|uniref:Runt- transcription factor n=1 Tax=Cichlidogyrus casuarinus TaxID=1844966 RepID=A0ABD2QGC3_9PLAT